jgi:hypothetical protein
LRETSGHKSCLIFFNTAISCVFRLVDPFRTHHRFFLQSGNHIADIILHNGLVFLCHGIFPYLIFCSLFITRSFCIHYVTLACHVAGIRLWLLTFPERFLWRTNSLCISDNLLCPSWSSLVRRYLGWFLKFYHVMIL